MHINVHYAIGIIIASISHFFLNLTLLEYSFIVFSAFIIDIDIIFSKFDKENNHRNLITHSIWPGVAVLIIGSLLFNQTLTICGISLILHAFIDTFDWGTNLFYTGKTIGPKFLISREEFENIDEVLSEYKVKHSFFVFRYYESKAIIITEIIFFALMVITGFLLATVYWYLMLLFFFFLGFHFYEYKKLKAIENG